MQWGEHQLWRLLYCAAQVNLLSAEIAGQVIEGAKRACARARIRAISGGHSIDAPEPVFGLAVTGIAQKNQVRQNCTATAGCELYLTKPLGIRHTYNCSKKEDSFGEGPEYCPWIDAETK